jgi:hypothetical protein
MTPFSFEEGRSGKLTIKRFADEFWYRRLSVHDP